MNSEHARHREPDRAWLMQVPPDQFKQWSRQLLDPGASPMLTVNRYVKQVRAGDPAWLWISGPNAGIYGSLVMMTDPVQPGAGFEHFGGVTQRRDRPWIHVQPITLLKQPILKHRLLEAMPELADLSIIRMPGGGTVHRLAPDEDRTLREAVKLLADPDDADRTSPWPPVPPPRLVPTLAQTLRDEDLGDRPMLADAYFRSPVMALGGWIRDRLSESGVEYMLVDHYLEGGIAGQYPSLHFFPKAGSKAKGQLLFIRFGDEELLWGLMPSPEADSEEFARALDKRSVQHTVWNTVKTCKRGLKWIRHEKDAHYIDMNMAEGLPKWAHSGPAPVVSASVPYADLRAMTSPHLGQWIAADLSRLAPLALVSVGLPVTATLVDYPLPSTDRRRTDPLIFISYRRSDNRHGLISNLRDALEEKFPTRVFLDDGIPSGSMWKAHLEAELTETSLMVVAVSDDAMKSEEIEWEIATFIKQIDPKGSAKPGLMVPIRLRRSQFDEPKSLVHKTWEHLAKYQALPGYLESRDPSDFVPSVSEAYEELQKRFRDFYGTPGNLERLEDPGPSAHGSVSRGMGGESATEPRDAEACLGQTETQASGMALVIRLLQRNGIEAEDLLTALPLLLAIREVGADPQQLAASLLSADPDAEPRPGQ